MFNLSVFVNTWYKFYQIALIHLKLSQVLIDCYFRVMTTRNSTVESSFFQRRSSVASDIDSEYLQFKEEFEKKEKEYRNRIHTLKKEVSVVKESLSKAKD